MSVLIPTENDVISISGIRVYPMDMELADSGSACPICNRWSIVNFSLISYRLGFIQCFVFIGNLHCEPKIWGISAPHALKFDLASTRPPKGTSLRKNTGFEPSYRPTFMRRSIRAVREFEKVW